MKCVICKHGETKPHKAAITLESNGTKVVFKGIPAHVCQTCGEEYIEEQTTVILLKKAQKITRKEPK